jgi:hypothetical protein
MSTAENPTRPHLLAAYRGHHQVLRCGSTQTRPPLRTPPGLTYWPPTGATTRYTVEGVNPNMSTAENPTHPHLLSAYRGHHQVLRCGSTQTRPPLRTPPSLTYWPPTGATTRYTVEGVNPNKSTAENPTRPHLLAAYRGHHQVLRWRGQPKYVHR